MWPLECACMNYEWGKPGKSSAVAALKSKASGASIDADKPYAEYWFGTHPSGPSHIVVEGKQVPLQTWLESHPSALGAPPYNPSSALPYLFKVLSVAKALSVQAHPDRARAAVLHATAPQHYKDDNHKPEMTCALTPFEAMCSFRAPADLVAHVGSCPELVGLIGAGPWAALQAAGGATVATVAGAGAPSAAAFTSALKAAYAAYMNVPEESVKPAVAALKQRLEGAGVDGAAGAVAQPDGTYAAPTADAVALRLCAQFPGDIGVFAPYWLNVIALAPGQAVFLPANEPHAYLSGDCMEVMAASDNVVRAGLTPKFKDVPTLVDMLTYAAGLPPVQQGAPAPFDPAHTRIYTAPVPEFVLYKTEVQAAEGTDAVATLHAPPTAAIVVVLQGHGSAALPDGRVIDVSEGQIWLQEAGQEVKVTAKAGASASSLLFFRTHANA